VRPKRRLGQHFLSDPRILARIAEALEAAPTDTVLEIGPGRGSLTAELVRRAARVVAIERDPALLSGLLERLPTVRIESGDALAVSWDALAGPGPYLVAGNIPYNITTPLIEKALEETGPSRIVFLVQREVADRLAAVAGTKAYGALSVGVQAAATVERLFYVSAGAFSPPPEVESAVVRLTPRPDPEVAWERRAEFRRLVTGLFGLRRKQLRRALRQHTGLDPRASAAILEAAGLDPVARPETVTPAGFARLHRALVDGGVFDG